MVEEISTTTEHGIFRLAAGKEVHIVEEAGDLVTVRDGDREIQAPISHFTRDMDLRDALLRQRAELQRAAHRAAAEGKARLGANEEDLLRADQEREAERLRGQLALKIEGMKNSLRDLDARISRARAEREAKGYRSGGKSYRQGTVSFSHDASQLDALIQTRDTQRTQLRQLESGL